MPQNIKEKEEAQKPYQPNTEEEEILQYLRKRIPVLKDSKKNILGGLNYEDIMKEADREYQPRFLREKQKSGNVILVQDEIKGIRGSRIVSITGKEGTEWRSDISEPLLMVKVQTALSILVDRNPEAIFKAVCEKYQKTSNLGYALWKRSWNIGRSKHQLKLFIFCLCMKGWAIAHTFPRKIVREVEILNELDLDNPEKNKYKKKTIVEYNDIYREVLDPYRTWIDDMTNLTDPWSMDDWYYEKDYSKDTFLREFANYANIDKVKFSSRVSEDDDDINNETKQRDDIITVGFYEGKNKDLYAIYAPSDDVIIYYSPLPNDDKKLSCWWTYWVERDQRTPYGIGLYEMLKHNKVMYDRLKNMTVDQLVMAIYPMLFYSGTNKLAGTGDFIISPGLVKQKLPGTTIEQTQIKYDPRGWESVAKMKEDMDETTGISQTLQGEITGKTLGEVLHAKDAALKRLNIPLANISQALEDEAYISLSWMNQIYSVPEVIEFANKDELKAYVEETGTEPLRIIQKNKENEEGLEIPEVIRFNEKNKFKEYLDKVDDEPSFSALKADFYAQLDLGIEQDREGNLIESKENRFFRVGKDIQIKDLKWEGKIIVQPQSILVPSKELERQRKLELFNLIAPVVQTMMQLLTQGMMEAALAMYKPLKQILEIQDEKSEDWLPEKIIQMAENPEIAQQMQKQQEANDPTKQLFVKPDELAAAKESQAKEQGRSIVPKNEVTNPLRKVMGDMSKVSNRNI